MAEPIDAPYVAFERFADAGWETMNESTPLPGAMPDRLPEGARQPADFDPIATAKQILRSVRAGTLATLDRNTGHPFASLVNVATDSDGAPLILVSKLSTHTANLEADGRCSILIAATGKGDPLAHPRLTTLGTMAPTDAPRVRQRFLARHPKSELYAGFGDFSFWRMQMVSAHLNGGFARAADLKAENLMTDLTIASDLLDGEPGALVHMNSDHADAVRLYATKLLRQPDGAWRMTGIDPEGCDLALGDATARLAFPTPIGSLGELRTLLARLAQDARKLA